MERIVIVGGGQAGASAAQKLRKLGYSGRLTLLAAEPEHPYQRPPLSKGYLLGEMDKARLYLRPESYYSDHDVELRLATPATAIDPAARTVTSDGATLGYDALILATGAVPHSLPATVGGGLDGVYTVRTLADIDAMAADFHPAARALVVGGGYIGLEAAAAARKRGLEVTLVEAAPRILGRVAATETADWFRALHAGHGVTILENTGLDRLEGEGRVARARLSNGAVLPVDLVIVGVGIRPDTTLAEAAGLTIENGIAVNEQGRTSDPAIWAAGDCASFPWHGRRIRLESVQNAIDQAETVAANILGAGTPYDPTPWFWSDQYDAKLQIAGLNPGYDRVVTREDGGRSHWYYAGDRFLAVDAINDPRAYMVGKRLLETGRTPDPRAIAEPATELKGLLKT